MWNRPVLAFDNNFFHSNLRIFSSMVLTDLHSCFLILIYKLIINFINFVRLGVMCIYMLHACTLKSSENNFHMIDYGLMLHFRTDHDKQRTFL